MAKSTKVKKYTYTLIWRYALDLKDNGYPTIAHRSGDWYHVEEIKAKGLASALRKATKLHNEEDGFGMLEMFVLKGKARTRAKFGMMLGKYYFRPARYKKEVSSTRRGWYTEKKTAHAYEYVRVSVKGAK